MNKIKIVAVLLLALLLTSGCSVVYNVEIYNNTINETFDLTDYDSVSMEEVQKNVIDVGDMSRSF